MCDTLVAVPSATADGAVWFGKNSDREPGEAQAVVHLPATVGAGRLQCTYVELAQASRTNEVVLSQPFWMWGAEMGANEHGLAIGNEAVFTRLPVARRGLTGMDLVRLGLERTATARAALELITWLLKEVGQGGFCGYRKKQFRYHNAFLLADPQEAWVLETAGPFWVAERVRGVRTISNALSIGREFDLLGAGTYEHARQQGWCKTAAEFSFANCFGDPLYRIASGGRQRQACTHTALSRKAGQLGLAEFLGALRDHAGQAPEDGWRMEMPCAHASWQPTRQAGQTTGSMISCLRPGGASMHWLTGTSSPCLSLFKPFVLGHGEIPTGVRPGAGYDAESLFWRHERLHRRVLMDYDRLQAVTAGEREHLEQGWFRAVQQVTGAARLKICQTAWQQHRQWLLEGLAQSYRLAAGERRARLSARYWEQQERLDGLPCTTLNTCV
jgi:dipeptidase